MREYPAIFNDHPENCIICNKPSYGEPQCEDCLNIANTFANKLSIKKKYNNNFEKLKNLFANTFVKASKEWNKEKKQSLCNQLIGIGFLCNTKDLNNDYVDLSYRLISGLIW